MSDSVPGLLCWLAVVPTAVFFGLEAQVRSVIRGRLRVYNAVDLFVMTIFYHLLFEVTFAPRTALLGIAPHPCETRRMVSPTPAR